MIHSLRIGIGTTLLSLGIACGSASDADSNFANEGNGAGSSGEGSNGSLFGKGSDGGKGDDPNCKASIEVAKRTKVDIVFIIDNSGSMEDEITQIRTNVNQFANKIGSSGVDYRVVFFTLRASNLAETTKLVDVGGEQKTRYPICVPPPLGGTNCGDNANGLFVHVDQRIESEDSFERFFAEYPAKLQPHLRPDSTKVFVEVTDDNSSLSSDVIDSRLVALPPAGSFGTATARHYQFHTISGWKSGTALTSTETCGTASGPGLDYRQLATRTGGIVEEICKTDYSGVLDRLAQGTVDRAACELQVPSSVTDPSAVVVKLEVPGKGTQGLVRVTDQSKCSANPTGWYFNDNSAPTRIILCTAACDTARATEKTRIDAYVGCRGPAPK